MTDRDESGDRAVPDLAVQEVETLEEHDRPLGLNEGKQWVAKPEPSENTRRFRLAMVLLAVTLALGVAILLAAWLAPASQWERVDRIATLVLVPFQTLLGTAIGWYFGGKKD